MGDRQDFVPALGFRWLTPLYDPVMSLLGEDVFKDRLVELVPVEPGSRVLDLGCGTATTTILLKERHPEVEAVGVDIDLEVLQRGREKSRRADLDVELVEGSATELPFEDESFDVVFSNLVFHHLKDEQKKAALRETIRVLRPGGSFLLADFGVPHGPVMRTTFFAVQIFDGFAPTNTHLRGRLEAMMEDAGFSEIVEVERRRSLLGSQTLYRCRKP